MNTVGILLYNKFSVNTVQNGVSTAWCGRCNVRGFRQVLSLREFRSPTPTFTQRVFTHYGFFIAILNKKIISYLPVVILKQYRLSRKYSFGQCIRHSNLQQFRINTRGVGRAADPRKPTAVRGVAFYRSFIPNGTNILDVPEGFYHIYITIHIVIT